MRTTVLRFLPAISLLLSGCYTQIRPPAGELDQSYDNWNDPYRDYYLVSYWDPWQMYGGHPWWYQDYCHPHWSSPSHPTSASYDDTAVRHGWDRGPGSMPPPAGIGGGVSTPSDPPAAPAETTDSSGGSSQPRDTDRSKSSQSSSEKRSKKSEPDKPRLWGR
ncbi:MAG: hypothetical protein KC729_11045 [Candidatus Eisenbacteria bacterium]|uniref:Lipoprotein n=1 Tax=Eiseniibacteriota bacterium TaxID=2212470 RepID=A0A956M1H3_UNCEI|nr:hypothetical protein [Candidatus Eisenbacteria bacterium]